MVVVMVIELMEATEDKLVAEEENEKGWKNAETILTNTLHVFKLTCILLKYNNDVTLMSIVFTVEKGERPSLYPPPNEGRAVSH